MTALSRTGRGLLAFVLIFGMLTSLGGSLPAAAAPNDAAQTVRLKPTTCVSARCMAAAAIPAPPIPTILSSSSTLAPAPSA